ncbi:MAG: SCP2 sterol-binding domain-containing protein [Methylotenera sp.]|nr:SCP2 sterol-binding domain-containing protein [Methylotenera sp.]
MIKGLYTQVLQHIIAQNSWASGLLSPFAAKVVQIHIPPVRTSLVILESGSLAIAGETHTPDACITIPASLLPRLMTNDEAAKLEIAVAGDAELATALAKVLSHLRWDIEDDLGKLIGDVPAYRLTSFGRGTIQALKASAKNSAQMLSEYWQEEKPMLAKKRHVEQFNLEVDTLRSDVARLEKRLSKLANCKPTKNNLNPNTPDSV